VTSLLLACCFLTLIKCLADNKHSTVVPCSTSPYVLLAIGICSGDVKHVLCDNQMMSASDLHSDIIIMIFNRVTLLSTFGSRTQQISNKLDRD